MERSGIVVHTELHRRSPEGRWYSQAQAAELFRAAGYGNIRLFDGFTQEPAREGDPLYCVLGER